MMLTCTKLGRKCSFQIVKQYSNSFNIHPISSHYLHSSNIILRKSTPISAWVTTRGYATERAAQNNHYETHDKKKTHKTVGETKRLEHSITADVLSPESKSDKYSTIKSSDVQSVSHESPIKDSRTKVSILLEEELSALKEQEKPKGVWGYIISRYTWYIHKLQKKMEQEMPRTFKMFRIFGVGLKSFLLDFRGYVRILASLSFPSVKLESLPRKDLELYHFMPWDMVKVFPVLAISAIPFGQNVGFPLGYLFPRHLLCRHFWDIQQTHDFSLIELQRRLYGARPVFRALQSRVDELSPMSAKVRAQAVYHQLGSGVHPSWDQVLELRPLFAPEGPYSIVNITRYHVKSLMRLHGVSRSLWGRAKLRDHARWLHCHDSTLTQEMLESMSLGDLKTSLLIRGINPTNIDSGPMVEVIQRWLKVSSKLGKEDQSLLLHLPILLFYNHPTNLSMLLH